LPTCACATATPSTPLCRGTPRGEYSLFAVGFPYILLISKVSIPSKLLIIINYNFPARIMLS
jgi:hypothetical protein